MLTAVVLTWLLRLGLAPLETLSACAAEITPRRPLFHAPESARAAAELSVLARALEQATRRLEDAFLRQQVFVHDAAHELKTAVTIVKSSLQLLASRPRTAREYARGLETCLHDCARMEELVQRMLQLARFEREPNPNNSGCDVAEVARDVAAQMERIAEIRQVSLAVEAPASLRALVSEDACASLLANLMLNAVQYTAAGGSVTTRVAAANSVLIEVSDTGRGIAPEDLPHLFERFWRGDSSRARSTGGAGLGLSICKAIVEGCGGEIGVASRLGEGTCVTVRLPRPQQDETAVGLPANQRIGNPASNRQKNAGNRTRPAPRVGSGSIHNCAADQAFLFQQRKSQLAGELPHSVVFRQEVDHDLANAFGSSGIQSAAHQFLAQSLSLAIVSDHHGEGGRVAVIAADRPADAANRGARRTVGLRHQRQFPVVIDKADPRQPLVRGARVQVERGEVALQNRSLG